MDDKHLINIGGQPQGIAYEIQFNEDELMVFLKDGRKINVPLIWYPLLENATKEELENYELLGDGEGIHWPDLDEDLSIGGFFKGISLESEQVA